MEAGLAIALVLLCFFFFLLGIKHRFPGINLTTLWSTSSSPSTKVENSPADPPLARLTAIENEVRSKKATEIVWSKAVEGLPLAERDAVQTLDNSRAIVTFDARKRMTMEENSLVVIRSLEQGFIKKEKRPFVEVVSGSLHGSLDATQAKNERLEVVMPTAAAELQAGGKDRQGAFRVDVNPDKTSNVTVYKGSATVQAQGVRVQVGENQATHIGLTTPPDAPRSLPGPVLLLAPQDGAFYVGEQAAPEVALTWSVLKEAARYHLQLSDNPEFAPPLIDDTHPEATLQISGLQPGIYYWRVAVLDAHGVEGAWSLVRNLEVIRPTFGISFPEEGHVIAAEMVWVEGEASPTDAVYLNGTRIAVNERGLFREQISLMPGTNLIVVEAVNAIGASRFQTRTVRRGA
jgi:hypothetical protein